MATEPVDATVQLAKSVLWVNGAPTEVLHVDDHVVMQESGNEGGSREEDGGDATASHDDVAGRETVLVMVPGNPGMVSFYRKTLQCLHDAWGGRVPVFCVSHAGHLEERHEGEGETYDLAFQIEHKLSFLEVIQERYTSRGLPVPRFALAGHSIGAHIILQMLRHGSDRFDIVDCALLFPTLCDMKQQAGFLNVVTRPGARHVTAAMAHVLGALPGFIQRPLLRLVATPDPTITDLASQRALRWTTAQNTMYMARSEFDAVEEVDWEAIEEHQDRLFFYYGARDGWAPVHHYEAMSERLADHPRVVLDDADTPHAFVLGHSDYVAEQIVRHLRVFPEDDDVDDFVVVDVVDGGVVVGMPDDVPDHSESA